MTGLIRNGTLPHAIVVGAIGFSVQEKRDFLIPYFTFTMLLLTF